MRKNRFITTLFLIISITTYAQKETEKVFTVPKNSVYINLNMPFLAPSVEYGRVLHSSTKGFLNGSAGIGSIAVAGGLTVPHQLTFNFGKRSSFFEVGVGGVFWNGTTDSSGFTERESSYNLGPVLGWRKYCKKHFFVRIYMNPLILSPLSNDFEDVFYILNTGFSFGYSF
jgi:hypothetical protein